MAATCKTRKCDNPYDHNMNKTLFQINSMVQGRSYTDLLLDFILSLWIQADPHLNPVSVRAIYTLSSYLKCQIFYLGIPTKIL